MSAKPLPAISPIFSHDNSAKDEPAAREVVNNVVEIPTGVGAIRIHCQTLEIAWPGTDRFCRIVDAEEFMKRLHQAVVAAEEMIFERSRQNPRK